MKSRRRTESQTIRGTDVVRELVRMYGSCPVGERRFHTMILDGRIPASRGINGRFEIDCADLPVIAEILGITAAEPAASVVAA
jgi:hypothetical protein